jgi:hypothetical protein
LELGDLLEKFQVFVERPGLFAPAVEGESNPAQLSMFAGSQSKSEEPSTDPEK